MRLSGKTAIVTGSGSGFGEGIVHRLAAEGANVVVNDISVEEGKRVTAELEQTEGKAVFCAGNVAVSADVAKLIKTAVDQFGGIDIMINNAGITHKHGSLLDVSEEEFDRVYDVNVKAIFLSTKAVVPEMRKRGGGVIINIGSVGAVRPRPGVTWYNGSKGAVITLTKSMAVELAADSIRVNVINPVLGETALLTSFMGVDDTPENRRRFLPSIPLGRFATPRDIGNAAAFLASEEASLVTGLEMNVDGGRAI